MQDIMKIFKPTQKPTQNNLYISDPKEFRHVKSISRLEGQRMLDDLEEISKPPPPSHGRNSLIMGSSIVPEEDEADQLDSWTNSDADDEPIDPRFLDDEESVYTYIDDFRSLRESTSSPPLSRSLSFGSLFSAASFLRPNGKEGKPPPMPKTPPPQQPPIPPQSQPPSTLGVSGKFRKNEKSPKTTPKNIRVPRIIEPQPTTSNQIEKPPIVPPKRRQSLPDCHSQPSTSHNFSDFLMMIQGERPIPPPKSFSGTESVKLPIKTPPKPARGRPAKEKSLKNQAVSPSITPSTPNPSPIINSPSSPVVSELISRFQIEKQPQIRPFQQQIQQKPVIQKPPIIAQKPVLPEKLVLPKIFLEKETNSDSMRPGKRPPIGPKPQPPPKINVHRVKSTDSQNYLVCKNNLEHDRHENFKEKNFEKSVKKIVDSKPIPPKKPIKFLTPPQARNSSRTKSDDTGASSSVMSDLEAKLRLRREKLASID